MQRSLVLNASYEPLSVVSSRRAVCLLLADKAELLEADGSVLRSERLTLPSPAVIRLCYMVRAPRRRVASVSRRAVFARDDYRCQYCGDRADSIDHVVPRSRGGSDEWDNLVAACRTCNSTKRNRTPAEAGMRLLRPCRPPRSSAWSIVGVNGIPDAWKPYLALAG
jgi:5-methylcytosine-specific restriction endonuclease McrA